MDGDPGPLDRLDVAPLDAGAGGDAGVGGECEVEGDGRHHRRRQDADAVAARLGVAAGEVVIKVLLDVRQGELPGVRAVLAGGEVGGGEILPAVRAVVEDHPPRPRPLGLGREDDEIARDLLRQLGVVAGLDADQPGVRRPGDVDQHGPPDRVDDALGCQKHVEAGQDHHPRQRVEHLDEPALVDDLVDLHAGQVVDGLGLDGRQDRRRDVGAVAAEVQVADQAILELRVRLLDRPRRVEPADVAQERHDQPPEGVRPAGDQAGQQDRLPDQSGQADGVVEHDFQEEDRQGRRRQGRGPCQQVGHLDPGPRLPELMVDVLLVIEHLAVRLRDRGHVAGSLEALRTFVPSL